jgi:pimeloyl-ACP methyl ester carboxylesterase
MVGEHDRVTPPASAVAVADALPDGRLEILEGAGHIPMMEAHVDFNRRLDAFARTVFDAPGRNRRRRSA